MKNVVWLFVASLQCFSLTSFARGGHEIGNGGDVVVCRNPDQSIRSAELLDYYEARVLRGMKINLGGPGVALSDKIQLALERLRELSPLRIELYRATIDEFLKQGRFLPQTELVDVPDSAHIALPSGCKVEQIAIQREPKFPGDPRFMISLDLWNALSPDSQVGLALHEAIYREALSYKHVNSLATRYLNSLIAADQLKTMTPQQFIDLLARLPFSATDVGGFVFRVPFCYLSDGLVECEKDSSEKGFEFYPSGNVRAVGRKGERPESLFKIPTSSVLDRYTLITSEPRVDRLWLKDERLPAISAIDAQGLRFEAQGGGQVFEASGKVQFDSNGYLEQVTGSLKDRSTGLEIERAVISLRPDGSVSKVESLFSSNPASVQGLKIQGVPFELSGKIIELDGAGGWGGVDLTYAFRMSDDSVMQKQLLLVRPEGLSFHFNGSLAWGVLSQRHVILIPTKNRNFGEDSKSEQYMVEEGTVVELYPSGGIKAWVVNDRFVHPGYLPCFDVQNQLRACAKPGTRLSVYQDGGPEHLVLYGDTELRMNNGKKKRFKAGTRLLFDPNGLVVRAE